MKYHSFEKSVFQMQLILQAEITGHEARVKKVSSDGEAMVMQGQTQHVSIHPYQCIYAIGHYRAADIQTKIAHLQERWQKLKVNDYMNKFFTLNLVSLFFYFRRMLPVAVLTWRNLYWPSNIFLMPMKLSSG